MHGCELFLGTVDENIAANAIEEMDSMGIILVWPVPGSEDTELRCLMEQEADHGEASEVHT